MENTDKEYILSLSYGKDSLRCLGAIKKLGLPLHRIIHVEIWATETIPADLPPMMEFKAKADKWILDNFGIVVEYVVAKKVDGVQKDKVTYQDVFYKTHIKGQRPGTIKSFPMLKGGWCVKLKQNAMPVGENTVQYLGIAVDEPKRVERHSKRENIILPLVEAGWTEKDCWKWCEDRGLLSPIYTTATRGGAGFATTKA